MSSRRNSNYTDKTSKSPLTRVHLKKGQTALISIINGLPQVSLMSLSDDGSLDPVKSDILSEPGDNDPVETAHSFATTDEVELGVIERSSLKEPISYRSGKNTVRSNDPSTNPKHQIVRKCAAHCQFNKTRDRNVMEHRNEKKPHLEQELDLQIDEEQDEFRTRSTSRSVSKHKKKSNLEQKVESHKNVDTGTSEVKHCICPNSTKSNLEQKVEGEVKHCICPNSTKSKVEGEVPHCICSNSTKLNTKEEISKVGEKRSILSRKSIKVNTEKNWKASSQTIPKSESSKRSLGTNGFNKHKSETSRPSKISQANVQKVDKSESTPTGKTVIFKCSETCTLGKERNVVSKRNKKVDTGHDNGSHFTKLADDESKNTDYSKKIRKQNARHKVKNTAHLDKSKNVSGVVLEIEVKEKRKKYLNKKNQT